MPAFDDSWKFLMVLEVTVMLLEVLLMALEARVVAPSDRRIIWVCTETGIYK